MGGLADSAFAPPVPSAPPATVAPAPAPAIPVPVAPDPDPATDPAPAPVSTTAPVYHRAFLHIFCFCRSHKILIVDNL